MSVTDQADQEVNRGYALPDLVCARCRHPLEHAACPYCGGRYETRDGMLFLLPDELRFIVDQYSSERASETPEEHV